MNSHKLSRWLHKWLSIVIGVQALIWAISGFYMVAVDIDFIHGDSLVRNNRLALLSELRSLFLDIADISRLTPEQD